MIIEGLVVGIIAIGVVIALVLGDVSAERGGR